jgi:hypothetical protein
VARGVRRFRATIKWSFDIIDDGMTPSAPEQLHDHPVRAMMDAEGEIT